MGVGTRGGVLAAGAAGVPGVLGLLLVMEAGLPLPVPADLLMLLLGERAAAGAVPLWLAAVALELVAAGGTAALYLLARGPARALLARLGPRVGLTAPRLERASDLLARRGWAALAAGRGTPGLRTVTVVAAAGSRLGAAAALPALVLGSSVFLQAHLALGYALGPAARGLLARARLPLLLALGAALLLAAVAWRLRGGARRRRAMLEGCCPACLAAAALARPGRRG